jgi:hypothetical protein
MNVAYITRVNRGTSDMIKEFESGENPRILRVGTDVADPPIPRWWRRLEERLKLDICFALRAKLAEKGYDIIWAEAENVGILLSFLKPQKPLVVIAHHLESPFKRWIIKATGISKRWAGIGYISNECKKFCINDLGITTDRLFRHESAKYLDCAKLLELS